MLMYCMHLAQKSLREPLPWLYTLSLVFFIILVIYSFDECFFYFFYFPQMLKSLSQMNKMLLLNRFTEANSLCSCSQGKEGKCLAKVVAPFNMKPFSII